jgi:TonB family protein
MFFVLFVGQGFLLDSIPPAPRVLHTKIQIVPRKKPAPVPKQVIREMKTVPVVPQKIAQDIPMKATLQEITKVVSRLKSLVPQRAQPVKVVSQSSSRAPFRETHAVPASLGAVAKPRPVRVARVAVLQYGRKSLVQSGVTPSFSSALKTKTPQLPGSPKGVAQQAVGIKSLAFAKAFPLPDSAPRLPTQLTDPKALEGYLQLVQRNIAAAKRYPEAERQALHKGRMKVAFTLLRNGEIERLRLKEKSKHERLNQAALEAVNKVIPFNGFPAGITEEFIDVVIPFRFELN